LGIGVFDCHTATEITEWLAVFRLLDLRIFAQNAYKRCFNATQLPFLRRVSPARPSGQLRSRQGQAASRWLRQPELLLCAMPLGIVAGTGKRLSTES
jgi:hypothetical protein